MDLKRQVCGAVSGDGIARGKAAGFYAWRPFIIWDWVRGDSDDG